MQRSRPLALSILAVLLGTAAHAAEVADGYAPVALLREAPANLVPASADRGLPVRGGEGDAPGNEALDSDDEPAIQQEVRAESAELEAVRAAEERAGLLEPHSPEASVVRAAARLGLESPLLRRLRGAFGREAEPAPWEAPGRIPGLPEIDHDLRRLQAEYDIPIEVNDAVVAYVRFFQAPKVREHFVRWLGRSYRYIPIFREILRREGLPQDTVYLAMIESGFANLATSRARAVGPWQFIGETGKRMGLKQDFFVDERRDPEKSARGAARYLKELYRQTGDWRLAWAGYNAGVGKIFKAMRRGQHDFWSMAQGRVLRRETKGYVPKLMAAAIVTRHAEQFGFGRGEVKPERWEEYDEVTVPHATALDAVARAADVPTQKLLELNPELRRLCTPPRPYAIKLPRGRAEAFAASWPAVSAAAGKLSFAHHRAARGESLAAIAGRYGVEPAAVARMNGMRPGGRLRPGTELVIPLDARSRSQIETAVAAIDRTPAPQPRERRSGTGRATLASRSRAGAQVVQIKAGDTLWSIAQRFGVAIDQLCRWNDIRNPRRHKLQIGHEIVVFPRSATGASLTRAG